MARQRRVRLDVEALEGRLVPATVRFFGSNLFISPSAGEPALNLVVTQPAANTFAVTDQARAAGTYGPVGTLFITGGNGADSITVDFSGRTYTGSLTANTGNGNDTFTIRSTGGAGAILGNTFLSTGVGNATVNLNSTGTTAVTFGGLLFASARGGNDSVTFGNGSAVSRVGGDFFLTGYNNVQLEQGSNDTFGGNVTILLGNNPRPLLLDQGVFAGSEVATVAGSFTIVGGPRSDLVGLRGLIIGKDLNVQLGNGVGPDPFSGRLGNTFIISSSSGSTTVINGNLNYTSGSGADSIDLGSGVINGNLGINVGDGNDSITLETFTTPTIINGNLTINAGNGNVFIGGIVGSTGNTALIAGNVSINLGNGNDTVSFDAGGRVGGTISYTSGNGNNHLTLAGAQTYIVNVTFGNGDDTFTLNNAAAVLTGRIDGGGRIVANVFQVLAGTIGSPFTLVNFP
jgi:hypothetical protein